MKKLPKFLQIAAMVLLVVTLTGVALAAEEEGGKPKKTALELFETTGWVGWLMLGVSIAGTTLALQYMVSITREKLAPTELAEELEALMAEGNYDEAVELCEADGGYLATIVGDGLRLRHAGYEHMIGALEQAAAEEAFKVNAKISTLSLLGNVAPLLGLLGTVTGMISSFQVIETLKAPTPGDLAKGVYESLVNTTMGLFIAIVFLTLFFFYKNKVTKLTLSINLQAVDMLKHMAPAEAH
jgi:biopolymer transport protein ExbB